MLKAYTIHMQWHSSETNTGKKSSEKLIIWKTNEIYFTIWLYLRKCKNYPINIFIDSVM